MTSRTFFASWLAVVSLSAFSDADIYRWDNRELIPGTEGIEPGPGVQLSQQVLAFAQLAGVDLQGANFAGTDLSNADFVGANLDRVNFQRANLSHARLQEVHFMDVGPDLTGADLSHANLAGVRMVGNASIGETSWVLSGADFTSAIIAGASLPKSFTAEQLFATFDFQSKNLRGVALGLDLSGVDFRDFDLNGARIVGRLSLADFTRADLTSARLGGYPAWHEGQETPGADLTSAEFEDAIITHVHLKGSEGFAAEQLYSTASYRNRNLQGIIFNSCPGCDFVDQDLTGAQFLDTDFTGADFRRANLSRTTFAGWGQLCCSNTRFVTTDLGGASLAEAQILGVDFTGSDLRNVNAMGAELNYLGSVDGPGTPTDLSGVNLSNASFREARISAKFDSATIYNQWTVFPDSFDPVAEGLTFRASPIGDFNADRLLDHTDVDVLVTRLVVNGPPGHWPDAMFDVNQDAIIDDRDHRIWVKELKQTWFGDANLDGEFNSGDLVAVFEAGKYEHDVVASWSEGDWDADGHFGTGDLVVAFQDGGYEQGPRPAAQAVPEPTPLVLFVMALIAIAICRRSVVAQTISLG